ncbi:MAG TPA: DUF5668 domain-containing protein [Ignavibacteriaceae bacterium]
MKTSHIFWGTLFITIGLLVLLNNFYPIFMDWDTLWKLWPLVIILLGLSIIIKHKYGKGVIAGLAAFILGFSIFASVKSTVHFFQNDMDLIFTEGEIDSSEIQYLAEKFEPSTTNAVFNFSAGAGSFKLADTTNELITAHIQSRKHNYEFSKTFVDSSIDISMEMEDAKFNIGGKGYVNRVDVALNPNPEWELNFEVGAAKLNIDLTSYKTKEVNVEMGAASIDLKMGELLKESHIRIEAGASDINVFVPKSSGCKVNISSALSSKKLNEFTKKGSGVYETENFETAGNKIFVDIECGVSSINIERF